MGLEEYEFLVATLEEIPLLKEKVGSENARLRNQKNEDTKKEIQLRMMVKELELGPKLMENKIAQLSSDISELPIRIDEAEKKSKKDRNGVAQNIVGSYLLGFGLVIVSFGVWVLGLTSEAVINGLEVGCALCYVLPPVLLIFIASYADWATQKNMKQKRRSELSKSQVNLLNGELGSKKSEIAKIKGELLDFGNLPKKIKMESELALRRKKDIQASKNKINNLEKSIEEKMQSISHLIPYSDIFSTD